MADAEEGVYSAYAGGGVALQLGPDPALRGNVLLQSVYGLTNTLNWEAPLFLEIGETHAVSFGSGLEYVFPHTNHLRFNVGVGVALRVPFDPATRVGAGPFAESAIRWLFAWGLGLSASLHAVCPFDLHEPLHSPGIEIYPSLALYEELW
jgi:hypothetical protein